MTELEQSARELVSRHLAGRMLPDGVRVAIEQAVADQLREGFTREMETALRQLIDTYAEVTVSTSAQEDRVVTDDNPPTVTDVHWTSIG